MDEIIFLNCHIVYEYMEKFIILPHQLFDISNLSVEYHYILWEHPHYFTKYKYNKKKLMLHRASMKYYEQYLIQHNFKVSYCEFMNTPRYKKAKIFDPVDKINIPNLSQIVETPGFLLSKEYYSEYKKVKKDKFMFHWFYMWGKKKINIIPLVKSQDKKNRKKLPKDIIIPRIPSNVRDQKYINEAKQYVDKHFKNNYGNTDNFLFPVTHKTANKWFENFIKKRFYNFGPYQDAIDKENDFLFHSYMSSSMNCGLITPMQAISRVRKEKNRIPLNSYEGYIRQLFWREYQRYCYIYFDFTGKNYFGNRKKLGKEWYTGTIGCEPVDTCIKNAFNNGYLNHIQRLMIMGNYMNLKGINPWEGLRWFIEFSCDSYEWVMYQNVLDMAFCVSGGRTGGGTMQKPYISSSNYILKMSNYKKGKWCNEWDKLYHAFLKKHNKKLQPFRYYYRSVKKV